MVFIIYMYYTLRIYYYMHKSLYPCGYLLFLAARNFSRARELLARRVRVSREILASDSRALVTLQLSCTVPPG